MSWFEERSLSFDGYCSKSDDYLYFNTQSLKRLDETQVFFRNSNECVFHWAKSLQKKKISMVCVLVSLMTSMWSLDRITIQVIVYANFNRKLTWIFKNKKTKQNQYQMSKQVSYMWTRIYWVHFSYLNWWTQQLSDAQST